MFRSTASMSERIHNQPEALDETLRQNRLLTEVDQLLAARQPDGSYAAEVTSQITVNAMTLVQEGAMPSAVSQTFQRLIETKLPDESRRRTLQWLGRSALEVAESGKRYHFSAAGLERVAIEVAEARRAEEKLDTKAQVFISPKMSRSDAPLHIAKAEHLADDDAVRVSLPIKDENGRLIGRTLQSLLVRDVPLEAWVAMLRDPANPFGKAFEIKDEQSAISVMRLFDQLDLDVSALPEGPVSIVAAVSRYVADPLQQASVEIQVDKYRQNQDTLAKAAYDKAAELVAFNKELAESLYQGRATYEVRRFINILAGDWNEADLTIINNHARDGHYDMTRQLAALLESAQQKILLGQAAVITDSDHATHHLTENQLQTLKQKQNRIDEARSNGAPQAYLYQLQAEYVRMTAAASIPVSGGCSGTNETTFGNGEFDSDGQDASLPGQSDTTNSNRKNWKKKYDRCAVPSCPTRPGKVECGPCGVCMGRCQVMYDRGDDPMQGVIVTASPEPKPSFRLDMIWPPKGAAAIAK